MAHPLPSSGQDPTSGEIKNTLVQEAVDILLKELHDFFGTYDAVEDFKVSANPGLPEATLDQKLFISYKSPEDDRFLPAIVARVNDLREVRMDVGNVWENLPNGAKRYGGASKATIVCTIASFSSLDIDRLTDYLQLFFLVIKVPDIQRQGIWLVPNSLSVSDPGTMPYTADRSIFRSQISVDCWLQWLLDVPDTNATITNINYRLQTQSRVNLDLPPEERA